MSITDWLHIQSYERQRRKEENLELVKRQERQRMKPDITNMARKAKPLYMEHQNKRAPSPSLKETQKRKFIVPKRNKDLFRTNHEQQFHEELKMRKEMGVDFTGVNS